MLSTTPLGLRKAKPSSVCDGTTPAAEVSRRSAPMRAASPSIERAGMPPPDAARSLSAP
jgi:hypothetical protein